VYGAGLPGSAVDPHQYRALKRGLCQQKHRHKKTDLKIKPGGQGKRQEKRENTQKLRDPARGTCIKALAILCARGSSPKATMWILCLSKNSLVKPKHGAFLMTSTDNQWLKRAGFMSDTQARNKHHHQSFLQWCCSGRSSKLIPPPPPRPGGGGEGGRGRGDEAGGRAT
jgi:hypothetical protein